MEKLFTFKASNSKVKTQIWPKFKLIGDFMSVLVTCQFDEDPIPIIFFQHSRAGNSKVNGQTWLEFEVVKILPLSWLPVSFMMIQSKMKLLSYPQHLLHYKSMGNFFDAQGMYMWLNQIVCTGQKVNPSKILCLSSLSASLKISSPKGNDRSPESNVPTSSHFKQASK